ncbi:MAG: Large-conductance mechanosensitive channel MscMJLR [Methanocella sp. PtaU1.Bin125]|nr:MAG: Large-conductance mechanosensitive channel MscMJLR [Methanocella sp. PtaU1.Bin125]
MQASGLEKFVSDVTIYNIINALVILGIAYVAARVVSFLIDWTGERMGLKRIPVKMITPFVRIAIYAVAIYYILISTLSLTPTQFVAVAGLIGAGIGFGLQDVFASYVGGLIIAFERPYSVGDNITLKNRYGEVKEIGIRATKILTPAGNTVTAPNSAVIRDLVSSSNAGDIEMLVVIDLFIDPSSDFDRAMKILKEAVITSKYVYVTQDRPVFVYLNDFPFYRRVRAKAYVYDLRHEFDFRSDVTVRAWRHYLESGINPPRADILNMTGNPWPPDAAGGEGEDTTGGEG